MHEADPHGHLLINSIAPTPESSRVKIFEIRKKKRETCLMNSKMPA